ncbi:MAG: hypothetical protein CVU71_10980 [Deltaproteobacteria bacterium HGW-Deltaproteobacteria-6]|jgi:tetratricopeptide (TPR) repeat protein|nr:MAG: hypothetical protein CVU71_10980 [Deltaproteobacteria bacterium HGW-Deltaproteobacteria-6]
MDLTISAETIDYMFTSAAANSQAKLDALAGTVLAQGIDLFQDEKYREAINAFKRSSALSPFSDNSAKAYEYIGQSYVKQEDTDNAIKTYKDAIRIYPQRAEFHMALGDIYIQKEMQEEALAEYEAAVKLDSEDAESRYSLGQSYITAGNLSQAREQFEAVTRLTPISAAGFYGLGQVARAEGDLGDAVSQLTKAIRVNKNFELAYVELGYAYADMGEFQKAEDQLSILESKSSGKSIDLRNYIAQVTSPKILHAFGSTAYDSNLKRSLDSSIGFNTALGPKTSVSTLSPTRLTGPDTSRLFEVKVAFSKDMDEASIINPYNWKISRATIRDNGGVYNYGVIPPATEAFIRPTPVSVIYDTKSNTATVRFKVSQNSTGNATIDPNHIVFKFYGVDAYNNSMDPSADEYAGFSGVA